MADCEITVRRRGPDGRRQAGQVLPLFVLSLVAILAFTALLFDGANAYVTRRRLQDTGDAAALAGANVLQAAGTSHSCSATEGPPPGSPRADIVAAVLASIDENLSNFDHANVTVTCPAGYDNQAVRVELKTPSSLFFAGPVLGGPLQVGTTSTAVNGQVTGSLYSVVELNPWKASWPNGRQGCPSVLFSGGPTVTFDGSIMINSACPAGNGGAFATNGNSATITLTGSARIRMVGEYSPSALTITPTPLQHQNPVPDPLAGLPAIDTSTLTEQSASRLILSNVTATLQPGIYRGGIELRNSSIAYFKPGIYYLDGGGLDVGAQAQIYSIPNSATSTTSASWATDCADTNCGVLIYNSGTASGTGAMGQVHVAAGAVMKMRSYDSDAHGGANSEYDNLLVWQSGTPSVSATYAQPVVHLSGGGEVNIGGTVYAPSAQILMGGGSGGVGGSTIDLTLQFISWDMQIQGNVAFHFHYLESDFARPTDYGLVQ